MSGPLTAGAATTTLLTLNPPSDPAGGACALPFSSGYASPSGGFNQATPLVEHRSVSLGSVAGHLVSIHFSFDTMDARYNRFEGWYLDNVVVTDTARGTIFSDDVESGTNGWVTSGTHGTAPGWHITTRRGSLGGPPTGHAWWYGNEATGTFQVPGSSDPCSDARNSGDLVSTAFVVGQNSTLAFDTLWQIESVNPSNFDLMKVQIDDLGTAYALGNYASGAYSPDPVNLATGNFVSHAEDLTLPGRVLGFSFTRWYNSADATAGPLGPGWTHTYNLKLTDSGATVSIRRGDGRLDTFTRNPDGSYANPPNVFDALVKNADATFTLTLTNQVAQSFSAAGQLTSIREPAGNQIQLAYVGGNVSTITDTVGRAITLGYDASNRLTSLMDSLGRKVTYAYDGAGRLATVTDKIGNTTGQNPALHQWKYAYDGATQHITTITDPDGRIRVTNAYDSQGRVSQQRDALNALSTFAYSAGQTVLTDPRSHPTTYTFDARMRLLSQSDLVGGPTYTLSYTYDALGNRTSFTDRRGKRTDFAYDPRGNLLTKTDPSPDGVAPRPLTAFAYDGQNNLTQITDARGFVTTLSYDGVANVLLSIGRQIDAITSAITKYEYADPANPGLPTRIIAPRGNTGPIPDYTFATSLGYDTQANLTTRTDPDGNTTTFGYDGAGRLRSFVDPDGTPAGALAAQHTWTIAYDENDRETRRADPLGNTLVYGYDGAGNRTSLTDRNGNVTAYAYDANTRLASVQQKPDPVGQPTLVHATTVGRDPNGNASRITQANGVATDYAYDALNRLTAVTTHPTPTTNLITSYILDGNGQPTSRTTGDGVVVSYTYDGLSRLTSVSATGLATIIDTYDPSGQRTQMVDGTGTTTYQYDGQGRLTQVAAPNGTLAYAYDLDGNRTTLNYPGAGHALSATYSPGSRLQRQTDWSFRSTLFSYTNSGLLSTTTGPRGTASYDYDNAQRLLSVNTTGGATRSYSYTLDGEGNRTAIIESLTFPGTTDSFSYGYDGLNRLKTVTGPVAESFTLDGATNLSARTGPAATYSYDGANRLLSDGSRSFVWSGADRLTQRGADTFSYDALGRMTSSTVGGVTRSYTYNGDGLLASRSEGVTTTSFLWDVSLSPAPLVQAGSDQVIHAFGPLYLVHADDSILWYGRDGLGSVRLEADGGVATKSFRYAAYGAIAQSTGGAPTLFGFAGELADPSGLVYLRARWYDPGVGRFTTRDEFPGTTQRPVSLNSYAYAYGNPALFTDPTGNCPPCLLAAVLIGVKVGLFVSDLISTAETLSDPAASKGEKALAATLFVVGLTSTGGEATAGRTAIQAIRATGVAGKIRRYSSHALRVGEGVLDRDGVGVAPAAILDAVKNPVAVVKQANGRVRYVGRAAEVVLDPEDGTLVTAWATSSAGWRIPPGE